MRSPPLATPWDAPVLVGLLALALVAARAGARAGGAPMDLRVRTPEGTEVLPLEDGALTVEGALGPSTLAVHADGRVRFVASPCPQQVCRSLGTISRSGEALVCIPNRVLVELRGGGPPGDLDAVTR